MAKMLTVFLVCFLLSGLTEGKPASLRQNVEKDASTTESAQKLEIPGKQIEVISVDDCSQFCSRSYPLHTYPIPSHHKACTIGCRSAQLDALTKWPSFPSKDHCTLACHEAYPGDKKLRYACETGCTATTIDSLFPDREVIYGEIKMNDSDCEMSGFSPFEEITNWMNSFANNFLEGLQFDRDMKKLTEHANLMSQLLPPAKSSVINYVFDDDSSMEMREYNFEGGFVIEEPMGDVFDFIDAPLFDDESDTVLFDDNILEPTDLLAHFQLEESRTDDDRDVSESLDSVYVRYGTRSSLKHYKWFLAGGALLAIGVVILSLSLLFGLGILNKDSDCSESKGKKMTTSFVQSHTPSTVKVSLDGGSKFEPGHSHYMVPVHIKVGGDKKLANVVV